MSGAVKMVVDKLEGWESSTIPLTMLLEITDAEVFESQANRPADLLFWVIDRPQKGKQRKAILVDAGMRVVHSDALTDPVQYKDRVEIDFQHQEVWVMHAGVLHELGFYIEGGKLVDDGIPWNLEA